MGGEGANGGRFLGDGEDAAKLSFEFCSGEFLIIDVMIDFEELVFADNDEIGVVGVRIFLGMIAFGRGDAAGIEHPLVGFHADG